MSSRSSSFYKHGIHLFLEQNYGEICCDFPTEPFGDKNNSKEYDSFTMSDDDWLELAKSIMKTVKQSKELQAITFPKNTIRDADADRIAKEALAKADEVMMEQMKKQQRYTAEIVHACGNAMERHKPLADPFCYQLGFLDAHDLVMVDVKESIEKIDNLEKRLKVAIDVLQRYASLKGRAMHWPNHNDYSYLEDPALNALAKINRMIKIEEENKTIKKLNNEG